MRAVSRAPLLSNRQTSTFVACAENRTKLVPLPSQVAPRGSGRPSLIRTWSRAAMRTSTRHRGKRGASGEESSSVRCRQSGHEPVLCTLPPGEPRHRLLEDQGLKVRRVGMLGERRLVPEDLVEEELRRLGQRLMDLEGEHAGLGLRLRQELADDALQRLDLLRLGFPERGDDQALLE